MDGVGMPVPGIERPSYSEERTMFEQNSVLRSMHEVGLGDWSAAGLP
jgi:hypothetical protein